MGLISSTDNVYRVHSTSVITPPRVKLSSSYATIKQDLTPSPATPFYTVLGSTVKLNTNTLFMLSIKTFRKCVKLPTTP